MIVGQKKGLCDWHAVILERQCTVIICSPKRRAEREEEDYKRYTYHSQWQFWMSRNIVMKTWNDHNLECFSSAWKFIALNSKYVKKSKYNCHFTIQTYYIDPLFILIQILWLAIKKQHTQNCEKSCAVRKFAKQLIIFEWLPAKRCV